MIIKDLLAVVAVACLGGLAATPARAADGPSFDCARVTSQVNRTICASPELSALDRQLAEHYRRLLGMSGSDAAALQREEAQWLREVRNPCRDAACIAQAYAVWDAVLVARGLRLAGASAASQPAPSPSVAPPPARNATPTPTPTPTPALPPAGDRPAPTRRVTGAAADAEMRPFATDPALLADARALRGKACAAGEDVPREAGFVPVPGALPVIAAGSVVLVRRHVDADFAVLLDTRRGACRMVDAVALPPHALVGNLLQCVVGPDDATAPPLSTGVGLRPPGQRAPIAYWEIDLAHGQFVRQPLVTLGWSPLIRCREPEVGD